MITTLTILICLFTVVFYAVHLYRKDEEDDNWADSLDAEALTEKEFKRYDELNVEPVGYCGHYYTTPLDIILLVNQLGVNETVCKEFIKE